jgi:hypothetical protein
MLSMLLEIGFITAAWVHSAGFPMETTTTPNYVQDFFWTDQNLTEQTITLPYSTYIPLTNKVYGDGTGTHPWSADYASLYDYTQSIQVSGTYTMRKNKQVYIWNSSPINSGTDRCEYVNSGAPLIFAFRYRKQQLVLNVQQIEVSDR